MEQEQNTIRVIEDKIKFNKESLIKIHLFIKFVQNHLSGKFSDREVDILSLLYTYGGITNKQTMDDFSMKCFDNKLCDKYSVQSIRNVLGKAREFGIVKRRKSNNWKITDDYLPRIEDNILVFKYMLTNLES